MTMTEWEEPNAERTAQAKRDVEEAISKHGFEKATALLLRDARKALRGPYPRYTPLVLEIETILERWGIEP